jgi:phosphoribosylformylglycinamidine cyclo-ligase
VTDESRPPNPAAVDRERVTYTAAGVDLDAARRLKERFAALVEGTYVPEVVGRFGAFAGGYAAGGLVEPDPVLVATADGVGTKVMVAQQAGRHDTVGEDLVNHCVNDLLAAFARPLFFLDYLATGALDESVAISVVSGVARACRANGLALIGGETAEMPDLYGPGRYDLAGFAVGVAPRARVEAEGRVREGDAVVGLPSSGLHTNGYSLARRVVFETASQTIDGKVPWGEGTWADALLAVHRSYLREVVPLLDDAALHGVAHVTGGGFEGNLPRVLPPATGARLDRNAWEPPPIFRWIAEAGGVEEAEMYRVFNMGVGLCLVVDGAHADRVARATGGFVMGEIERGGGVRWE